MVIVRKLAMFLVFIAALAAACSTNDPSSSQTPAATEVASGETAETAESGAPKQAVSCSSASTRPPGDIDGVLTSGGLDRTYLLHLPPQYDGRTRLPFVINLHGYGSNAREQMNYSRFNALADREGVIVVAPEGSGSPQRWTFPGLGDVDDVAFVGELIDELAATYCIDESSVYATGISNGAGISTFIACGLAGRIAAIGAVAATAAPRTCGNGVTVPLITFRGTADACVPYEGGRSACGMMLPVVGAEEATRLWGEQNGCDPLPASEQVSESVRTTAYTSCEKNADAILYTIQGGGHTWPGSIDVPRLGAVTAEIDATALIWEFFERHSTRQH